MRRVFAGMRCERRQPTRREWAQITRSRLVASAVIRSGTPCKARHPMNAGGIPPLDLDSPMSERRVREEHHRDNDPERRGSP